MLRLPTRRQVLTGAGAAAALTASTGVYAFGVEPLYRLVVTRYAPTPARWTPGLNLRIAALADFHVCEPFMPLDRVAEIVDATNALNPDIVLLLGDYPAGSVALRRIPMIEFARVVEGLKAPLGVHAILGNHDWWQDVPAILRRHRPEAQRALEARGIPVMENDVLRIVKDGRPFWLAGLGDVEAFAPLGDDFGLDDLPGTLAKVTDDAPVILMAHEPYVFDKVPDRVSLTLSGHTHGGQVRLFGYSPALAMRREGHYDYGHFAAGPRHLIVSGGFGVSRVPVRFGVPPEIVLVEIGAPPDVA